MWDWGSYSPMAGSIDKGFKRLRNSAVLATASSAISAALFPLERVMGRLSAGLLAELLVLVGLIAVAGLVALVLSLASWIYKVLGWSDMCRSRLRRFYCITRLAVLVGPIVAVALIMGGVAVLSLELLAKGGTPSLVLRNYRGGAPAGLFLAGLLLLASANVIEGVAILDLGLLTRAKLLVAGSITYLLSTGLSPVAMLLGRLEGLSNLVSIVAYTLLAVGFHKTRWEGEAHEAE